MNLEEIKGKKTEVILRFAIPSIVAMVMTSLITIVDGIFIGNYVGAKGLAAVNLGLPIVYLYLAAGLMVAVGGSSIASRFLGGGKLEEANNVFRQTIITTVIVSLMLTLFFAVILGPISKAWIADAGTGDYFYQYYRILIFELPVMVITTAFGMFIRGEGNPGFVMFTNILNVLLNLVLDAVFIIFFGWGVMGIAWASLIAAAVALAINILYILSRAKVFHFGKIIFSREVWKETFLNGSSEGIGEMAMCLSMAAYNYVILKYIGVSGVAAFTIVGYVSYVYSMVVIGFGQGMVPLVSFTFGAKEYALAIHLRKITNKMLVCAAAAVWVAMILAADKYAFLFSKEVEITSMVIPGLRIQILSFFFMGINTITSFYFTAIGKAKESAVISILRGLLVLLICIFTLPAIFGINGVWFVSLVNEGVTLVVTMLFIRIEKDLIVW